MEQYKGPPMKSITADTCNQPPPGKTRVSRSIHPQSFVTGFVDTPAGKVPRVSSALLPSDFWGTFKARWGVGRINYSVGPDLYALGDPADQSPIVVTANYKMSFDKLRASLKGRNAWMLVLDNNGVNVWFAAGKGTFFTNELVERIKCCGLDRIAAHRQLIPPQLAGPGIASHHVKRLSGYNMLYGPIRAQDLPKFIENGYKADPKMRKKSFSFWERMVFIPVELVSALKATACVLPILFYW